jgi:hypothetical protein
VKNIKSSESFLKCETRSFPEKVQFIEKWSFPLYWERYVSTFWESQHSLTKRARVEVISREWPLGAERRSATLKSAQSDRRWSEQKTQENWIICEITNSRINYCDRVRIGKVVASDLRDISDSFSDRDRVKRLTLWYARNFAENQNARLKISRSTTRLQLFDWPVDQNAFKKRYRSIKMRWKSESVESRVEENKPLWNYVDP